MARVCEVRPVRGPGKDCVCLHCGKPAEVCEQWRTEHMPASAFFYYCLACWTGERPVLAGRI